MYIKRITLKNIRGFDELDFDLTRGDGGYAGWTVFTGDNGSGKSALLKAIVVGLLGKEIARALQPSFQGWIRDGENEASIKVETIERFEDDAASPLYGSTELGKLELKFENIGRETKLYDQHESDTFSWSHKGFFYHSFFICSYGPFRRMSGPSADACIQLDRRYIIIEKESEYVRMARKRVMSINPDIAKARLTTKVASLDRWAMPE